MKTISNIEVHGFQSLWDISLGLHPNFNVIYGPNDSGKSAIFRSLRFACLNVLPRTPKTEEKRDDNLHWDLKNGEAASVGIEFSDDSFIVRKKSPNGRINQYLSSSSEEPLTSMGQKLPTEIFAITGIDETNFQKQEDLYFLLNETPGKVAREFSRLANLEISEILLRKFKEDLFAENEKITFCKSEIENEQEKLKRLKDFNQAKKEFNVISRLNKENENLKNQFQKIKNLVSLYTKYQKEVSIFKSIETAIMETKKILTFATKIIHTKDHVFHITSLTGRLQAAMDSILTYKELSEAEKELKSLKKILFTIQEGKKKVYQINSLFANLQKTIINLKEIQINIKDLEKKETKLKEELKICFICGSKFN